MGALRLAIDMCPTLRTMMDFAKIERSAALFNKRFPKAEQMRHAAAHTLELGLTAEDAAKNAFRGAITKGPIVKKKQGPLLIIDGLMDGVLHTTRKGEMLKFDFTQKTINDLKEIQMTLNAAFEPVPEACSLILRARAAQSSNDGTA